MTTPLAYYVDDEEDSAQRHIRYLNEGGRLDVRYLPPTRDLSLSTVSPSAQLFFVDWELDTKQATREQVNYSGGTFALRLRDQFDGMPIVLVTREDILDPASINRYVESPIFDDFIPKRDIAEKPDNAIDRCISLIEGFRRLRRANKTWQGLLNALGATDEEAVLLGESTPPLRRRTAPSSSNSEQNHASNPEKRRQPAVWRVSEVAQWITGVVLRYPGILYDSLHAATFLGIDEEEFRSRDVQDRFASARYEGVFAPAEGRWWKARLSKIARGIISEAEISSSSVNRGFARAFGKLYLGGAVLQPARSVWGKEVPADWVCYVLKQPVRIEYSLVYHPDNRPSVMDDARVSFKAIRQEPDVFDEYFDPSSRQLLEGIRKLSSDATP
jgi:hypothetical protein